MIASIRKTLTALWVWALAHKIWAGILLVVILGGGWWTYGKLHPASVQTRYVLGTVTKGTVIGTVSGSGQVSATDQINIQAKASGTITWVGVSSGNKVRAGQALATIDNTTALQSLDSAKKSLAASQLQYQKDSAQAPISYQNDVAALATAKQDLQDSYNTTYNNLTSMYLDMPAIMNAAQNTLYGYDFDPKKSQWNKDQLLNLFTQTDVQAGLTPLQKTSVNDYNTADTSYSTSLASYQQTPRTASNDDLDALLAQSITTMTAAAQALQTELNFFGAVSDYAQTYKVNLPSSFTSIQNTTRAQLSSANSDLSTLLANQKTLANNKQAITNAEQAITLDNVGNPDGTNPISLQISKNNIEKARADIVNQEANLADYTIRAPFDGTISAVNVKVGDNVSGAVATIVSSAQVAELSLNEVDAAKISLGDKASMTFDAIDGLTLTGKVAEIDPVGTVSQGVVSYNVKIQFDTQDNRVKPGMTINADIQTQVHQDVLIVPSTAIKTQGGESYVQAFVPEIAAATVEAGGAQGILSATSPQNIPVTVGISDDTNTEILSGLTDGQQIVTKTTTNTTTTSAAASATSRTGGTRAGGIGGGAVIRGF